MPVAAELLYEYKLTVVSYLITFNLILYPSREAVRDSYA
jgi:hypothetical protein